MNPLKYYPRLKLYKASNLTFNPETLVAQSYNWWTFVAVFRGQVVFNEFKYSNTTARHQYRVRLLMQSLGIKDVLVVSTRFSLCNTKALLDALETAKIEAKLYEDKAKRARSRKAEYLSLAAKQLFRANEIQKLIARMQQPNLKAVS